MESVRRTNTLERPPLPYRRTGTLPPWAPQFLVITGVTLLVLVIAIVAPFWFTDLDSEILTVITPFAMWLPAIIILVLHLLLRPPVRFLRWSGLPARPFAPVAGTAGVLVLIFVALPAVVIALTSLSRVVNFTPNDEAAATALLVLPLAIVTMLSTLGEELAWRGYLQSTLAPLGFWRASVLIGAYWSLWHLPLTLTYLMNGVTPAREVVATSVNLLLAALVLSAARYLSSSVWPSVLGHALINTSLVYAYSNLITPTRDLGDGAYWAFQVMSWVCWGVIVAVLGSVVARRSKS